MIVSSEESYEVGLANLVERIEASLERTTSEQPQSVRAAIRTSFSHGCWLTEKQRQGSEHTYVRHVLYGDPNGRFTIVALVWGPGHATPVHGHKVWCALAVVDGTLQEEFYTYRETHSDATLASVAARGRLDGSCALPGFQQIHRIKNMSAEPAISIHVYGIDQSEVTRNVNRLVDAKH
jgi:predicted metal-dependent enzyme (double-stranded beta helix superfamily)